MDTKMHTVEPWTTTGDGNLESSNYTVYLSTEDWQTNGGFHLAELHGPDKEANARRIVACVNACADITTEELEEQVSHGKLIRLDECQACEQRDKLLDAFNAACAFIDCHAADPDITEEMCAKYAEFDRQRDIIKELIK